MPSFSQLRDMYKLQRQAKKVKKELANIHVEAEGPGVKVVVTAEPEVVSVAIDPATPRERVPTLLVDTLNRALRKAQVVSAEKSKHLMEQMGMMPGT